MFVCSGSIIMGLKDLDIRISYRSKGENNITQALVNPALKVSKTYKRSVGFFSSSVVEMLLEGLTEFMKTGEKIQLVTSTEINKEDAEAISLGYKHRESVIKSTFEKDFQNAVESLSNDNLKLLYNLIASNFLDIKIAVTKSNGIYHDKLGILEDYNGDIVVFFGSSNSSIYGYQENYEKIRVVKSWVEGNLESVKDELAEFDSIWNDNNPHLSVSSFKKTAAENLLNIINNRDSLSKDTKKNEIVLRDYQQDAINAWVANNFQGFYVMATGTGKTWTAIYSAKKLLEEHDAMVVIAAPYKHLVSQWANDVKFAFPDAEVILVSSENNSWETQLTNAIIRCKIFNDKQIIVITTNTSFNLPRFTKTLNKSKQEKLLIVDEAHRFTNRNAEIRDSYKYLLGLSATPYSGVEMSIGIELMNFFGGQVYNLPIEVALKKEFLVPYYYYPIFVFATEDEERLFDSYSSKMASCFKNGICIDKEKLILYKRQRLRCISMAEEKTTRIREILSTAQEKDHLIVYCGDGKVYNNADEELRHIDFVKQELSKINHRASQFTASENIHERIERIESFNIGSTTALAAIRCLDEGINIPSIKGALILSSNDSYREFAQRRGRILRLYPGKESANIYDVIVLPQYGCIGMAKIELRRFYEYAKLAKNYDDLFDSFCDLLDRYGLEKEDIEYSFDNNYEESIIDE